MPAQAQGHVNLGCLLSYDYILLNTSKRVPSHMDCDVNRGY